MSVKFKNANLIHEHTVLSFLLTSVLYKKYPIVLKNMSIDIYH